MTFKNNEAVAAVSFETFDPNTVWLPSFVGESNGYFIVFERIKLLTAQTGLIQE